MAATDWDALAALGKIAAPAGLAIGAFVLIARTVIAKAVLPMLTKERAYHFLIIVAFLSWSIALAGIAAWLYHDFIPQPDRQQAAIAQNVLNDLSDRRFDEVYAKLSGRRKEEFPPHKLESEWDIVVEKLGDRKRMTKPILSTFKGNPAYVATYEGTKGRASVDIGFNGQNEIDLLWFDWSQ